MFHSRHGRPGSIHAPLCIETDVFLRACTNERRGGRRRVEMQFISNVGGGMWIGGERSRIGDRSTADRAPGVARQTDRQTVGVAYAYASATTIGLHSWVSTKIDNKKFDRFAW